MEITTEPLKGKISEDFNIVNFVRNYVHNAFEVMRGVNGSGLDTDEFYARIHERVGKCYGFDATSLVNLHHPFHWTFFTDNRDCEIDGGLSPFILEQIPERERTKFRVKLRKPIERGDEILMTDEILERYKDYLAARCNAIRGA